MKAQYQIVIDEIDDEVVRLYVRPLIEHNLDEWILFASPEISVLDSILDSWEIEVLKDQGELIVDGEFQVRGE